MYIYTNIYIYMDLYIYMQNNVYQNKVFFWSYDILNACIVSVKCKSSSRANSPLSHFFYIFYNYRVKCHILKDSWSDYSDFISSSKIIC